MIVEPTWCLLIHWRFQTWKGIKKFADMFKYSIIWSFIFGYFWIYFSLTLKTVTFKLSYVFLIIPLFWKIYHISLGLNKSVIGASKWNYISRRIKISHSHFFATLEIPKNSTNFYAKVANRWGPYFQFLFLTKEAFLSWLTPQVYAF